MGIVFVKIDDPDETKEYGIEKIPTLMYFEKGIPMMYEGAVNIALLAVVKILRESSHFMILSNNESDRISANLARRDEFWNGLETPATFTFKTTTQTVLTLL